MKKQLIPIFCLLHMVAIFWWALPHSFGALMLENNEHNSIEAKLINGLLLNDSPKATAVLTDYIDVTGSQQYWDFFAPHSPKVHQYLSVCDGIIADPEQEKISCKSKPLFSNLDDNGNAFKHFGSDRSRLYRLTENLVNLDDPHLLARFAQYYQAHQSTNSPSTQLVLHQFELHPELNDLPRAGYRMDKLLFSDR
ncbi:MAG: hypothetical protein EXR90_04800 [Methyloglobulus sp.]|nr:hypothetical protein [Methyloglobulus sp.]